MTMSALRPASTETVIGSVTRRLAVPPSPGRSRPMVSITRRASSGEMCSSSMMKMPWPEAGARASSCSTVALISSNRPAVEAITSRLAAASTWIESGWFAWAAFAWKASVIASATRGAQACLNVMTWTDSPPSAASCCKASARAAICRNSASSARTMIVFDVASPTMRRPLRPGEPEPSRSYSRFSASASCSGSPATTGMRRGAGSLA